MARRRPQLVALPLLVAVLMFGVAAAAEAGAIWCCAFEVGDEDPTHTVQGIQFYNEADTGDSVQVRATPTTVVVRTRVAPITGNCALDSPHQAICSMPAAWQAEGAHRGLQIFGSEHGDRLIAEPLDVPTTVGLYGAGGDDTLIATPPRDRKRGPAWLTFSGGRGVDRIRLGPYGPQLADRLRERAGALLLDLRASARTRHAALRLTVVDDSTGWSVLADGRALVGRSRSTTARLPLTAAGRAFLRRRHPEASVFVWIATTNHYTLGLMWLRREENRWMR